MQLNLPAYLKRNSLPVLLCTLIILSVRPNAQAQTPEQRRQIQLKSNIKNLATIINAFTAKHQSEEAAVAQYLRLHPGVKRMFEKNRSVYYLKRISKDGLPVYINTKNKASGEMIGVNQLYAGGSVGANVTGTSMVAGVWDVGQVRATHELLTGKVAMQANQTTSNTTGNDHMTHVSGTMVGKDIPSQPSARGIAYDATAQNYDAANDAAEMAAFAAGGFILSNHSYGLANDNTTPLWQFGAYDDDAKGYDVVTKNAPFYLPFVAAGNEQTSSGNPTKAGYDIITGGSAAKNVVTVGALNGDSAMSEYSNWGPTDDGRFKPEVVAKGTGINSSTYTSDNSYSGNGAASSGTSYASPAAAAASLLLQQYYKNITTVSMRAATLKGLIMHTAHDLGNPGPDYKFGWGLISADKAANLIKSAKASATPQGSSITEVTTNPANNGTEEMIINVVASGTAPLKVSIAWTDDEGPEQVSGDGVDPTTGRLVYHFDVLVRNTTTAAETRPWRPMGMTNRTANATRGSAWFEGDNNNYRQVLIESPTANTTYAIVIRKSAASPAAVRPFSLIVSGLSTGSVITDLFRSKQTGNWNDVNTWESSPDGTTWSAATLTPDFNSNTITIRNPHTVTVTANLTIDQTTINSQSVVMVNPGIVLTINDGAGTDLSVTDIAGLVLKSTAAGTASIGTSSGTISGQVVVERYNSNKRAWRLLGIPYSATAVSIRDTWMEQLTLLVTGSIPAGYGTQITTFNGDSRASNFDGQKPGSSIRIYAADNFNSDLAHTPNTTDNLASNQAYFLFVRGDRSIDRTAGGAASSATTLRTYGTPSQGNVTKGVTGTSFSLIPNPYPSQINFDAVKAIAANTSISTFYVWDATLGTVGQYRTVQVTGTSPNYTYTATPGSADNNWRFIESGAAFMVPGNRTVQFTEATKSAGTPPSSMFRTDATNETGFAINMYIVNADNTATLADGVKGVFDNAYTSAIDNDDAKKITGFEVNLGIANQGEVLSIEKRPMISENDVIALKLWNAAQGKYRFEVQPANFPSTALLAYIKDKYLDTYTPLSLTADTKVDFTITADAASAASDRFSIVFSKTSVVNRGKPVIVVYPNPVQNGIVSVRFNSQPKGVYTVKIVNALGQAVISRRIEHAGGSSVQTINVNRIKGTYMLEVINPDNTKQSQKIIINN